MSTSTSYAFLHSFSKKLWILTTLKALNLFKDACAVVKVTKSQLSPTYRNYMCICSQKLEVLLPSFLSRLRKNKTTDFSEKQDGKWSSM